jgi:hypothetical protein
MPHWLFLGLILLVMDLLAVGVFTGHTERFIRMI